MKAVDHWLPTMALLILTNCMSTAKRPLVVGEILQFKENQTQRSHVIEYYGEPQSDGITGNLQNVCYYSNAGGERVFDKVMHDIGEGGISFILDTM